MNHFLNIKYIFVHLFISSNTKKATSPFMLVIFHINVSLSYWEFPQIYFILWIHTYHCAEDRPCCKFLPKDRILISAVILASASSSSWVRGRSRWAPLRLRGASWRSCKRRLVFLVCSLVDCRTDFRAKERWNTQLKADPSQALSSYDAIFCLWCDGLYMDN